MINNNIISLKYMYTKSMFNGNLVYRNFTKATFQTKRTMKLGLSGNMLLTSHRLDLDLKGIRPGIGSDGNFSSNLIGRS